MTKNRTGTIVRQTARPRQLWTSAMTAMLIVQCCLSGCQKHTEQAFPQQAAQKLYPVVLQLQQRIATANDSRLFFEQTTAALGQPAWSHALVSTRQGQALVWLPVIDATAQKVTALLVCEWDTRLRIKIITPDSARQGTVGQAAQTHRALALLTYLIWGRQPKDGGYFHGVKTRRAQPPSNGRSMGWEVTTCYEWVACTGDGYGNCMGNVTLHSDCTSEVFWMGAFNFVGDGDPYTGQDPVVGSGSPGGTSNGQDYYILPVPRSPIENLEKYLSCFNLRAPAKLMLYADQPVPGSDEPFSIIGKMGHVFLAIEQQVNGQTIRRNVGFHPASGIDPFTQTSSPSILGDDQQRPYDVSLTIALDGLHLSEVVNMIYQHPPMYDLENYNCVDFVLDVAQAGGLTLPRTKGWWIFGSGRNPGSFGEDLRRQSGAATQSGIAAPNEGTCL